MKINITGAKPTNTKFVPLSEIEVDKSKNLRFQGGDPADLVRSIREQGQKHAVGARLRKGQKPLLAYGFGRYEALSLINAELPEDQQLPIKVDFFEGNEDDSEDNCLAESIYNPFTHMDYANVIKVYRERRGLNGVEIAAKMGKSQPWVSQHDSLNRLSRDNQEKVHVGLLDFTAALDLARRTEEEAAQTMATIEATTPVADAEVGDKPKKAKKIRIQDIKAAVAINSGAETPSKLDKRSQKEMDEFFEVMPGSPPISPKLQAVAQVYARLRSGEIQSDEDGVDALEAAIAGTLKVSFPEETTTKTGAGA